MIEFGKVTPCELAHFLYNDKPVSKYELHWRHGYNSKTFFISEQDYHKLMDQYCEELFMICINHRYSCKPNICMTITR